MVFSKLKNVRISLSLIYNYYEYLILIQKKEKLLGNTVNIIYFKKEEEKGFLNTNLPAFLFFEITSYIKLLELLHTNTFTAIIITEKIYNQLSENEKFFISNKIPITKIILTASSELKKTYPENFLVFKANEKLEDVFYNYNEITLSGEIDYDINELFNGIFNKSPNAILVFAREKIIITNEKAIALLKVDSIENLSISNFINFIHPEDRNLFLESISDKEYLLKNGKNIELNWLTNSGEKLIIEIEIKATELKGNHFLIFFIKDITEIKKRNLIDDTIQNILHKSNTAISSNDLFEIIHSSLMNLMPVKNFFIALYDKIKEEIIFPYYVDEFDSNPKTRKLGNGFSEYILRNGEPIIVNEKSIEQLIIDNEIQVIGTKPKVFLGVPLKINGNSIGVLAVQDYENENAYSKNEKEALEIIAFPISRTIERKINEEERKSYINELTLLNTSKDKLFSIISHDLRSPFNSILGFVEILKSEFDDLDKEEALSYINLLDQATNQLYQLLTNLLQFSRFQLGKVKVNKQKINIKSIILNTIELLQGNILRKELSITSSGDENIYVFADHELLHSAIQNIISNSIKFTKRKGSIKICWEKVDKNISIKIVDDGIGMSDEIKKTLFKSENIISTPGTENEPGTGLGLTLVKEFIEANNGTLSIESCLNEGTIFIITLPEFN